MKRKPYKFNPADPRTQRRLVKVLGWVTFNLSPTEPSAWHQSALNAPSAFGQQQNPLSAYLRGKLLRTERNAYSYTDHTGKVIYKGDWEEIKAGLDLGEQMTCKTYTRKQDGYEWLLSQLDWSYVPEKWRQALTKSQELPARQVTGGISVLQVLGLNWAQSKYGDQLESAQFVYKSKPDGRHSNGLQNVKREHKLVLWRTWGFTWDYDIEACAPTLLYQRARLLGFEKDTPAYDTYLDDRQAAREHVAFILGVDIDLAKKVLTSLFNRARLDKRREGKMMNLLKDARLIGRLQNDEFVTQLNQDIGALWSFIRKTAFPDQPKTQVTRRSPASQVTGGISVLQVPSVSYLKTKALTGSQRWAFYYSLERKVIDVVHQYLDDTNNPHFLEHDGWRCKKEVDTSHLRRLIAEKTGFNVNIDMEKL